MRNLGANPVNLTCALVRTGGLSEPRGLRDLGSCERRLPALAAVPPRPLPDNFGIVLRVTLNQEDTLGRIPLGQQPPAAFTQ